jgi:tetratricopeptide (TPR) repeat protein
MAAVPLREGRRLLAELARAHLLAEPVPGRFAFHDLLRAYAAERAQADESEAERRAATGRMLDHYLHTAHPAAMLAHHTSRDLITLAAPLPGVEPERMEDAGQALAWFDAEHQVLMAAAAQALETGFDVHAWQIPWALGRFLELRGPWHDWVAAGQIALAATQRLGDRTAQAFAHRRLGFTCGRLGDYEAAHAQLEQALSIYTELGDLPGQADVNQVLAAILDDEGREREALGHAQRALELFTATGDRGGQAMALNAVGWLHAKLGDPRQALVYCGQAIDLLEELARHSQTAAGTWDSLGYAHQQLGNHAESAACYQRALDLLREIGDRRGQADTLVHIGDAQLAAGHPGEARAAWEEALTILDDLHDPYAAQIRTKLAGPAT